MARYNIQNDIVSLQGLGVDSDDDRSVFKREIKNLKPFADKQKKVLEKQRKEEKKNAKKNLRRNSGTL